MRRLIQGAILLARSLPSFVRTRVGTLALASFGLLVAYPTLSSPSWQAGNISAVTSWSGGLMITLDSGLPDNCAGTPYGWMTIAQTSKTMIAVALLAKIKNSPVVVYTDGIDASGYCTINQIQPASL